MKQTLESHTNVQIDKSFHNIIETCVDCFIKIVVTAAQVKRN